jgi:hypothetical protein
MRLSNSREGRAEMTSGHAIKVISFQALDGGEQHNYGCICQREVGDFCPEIQKKLLDDGNTPIVARCLSLRSAFAPVVTLEETDV